MQASATSEGLQNGAAWVMDAAFLKVKHRLDSQSRFKISPFFFMILNFSNMNL